MKFYKNDIVEIIEHNRKGYLDYHQHELDYYENNDYFIPYTGQRFKIHTINKDKFVFDSKFSFHIHIDRIILYKRPLKNWIFYFIQCLLKVK